VCENPLEVAVGISRRFIKKTRRKYIFLSGVLVPQVTNSVLPAGPCLQSLARFTAAQNDSLPPAAAVLASCLQEKPLSPPQKSNFSSSLFHTYTEESSLTGHSTHLPNAQPRGAPRLPASAGSPWCGARCCHGTPGSGHTEPSLSAGLAAPLTPSS